MRYEKGRKDTTHDRILEVAARKFRQAGIAGSGLAGIMSEAGLTNGAFYAHFSSKSEMVEKSLERATDEQWQQFEKEIVTPSRDALQPRFFLRFRVRSRIRGASTPRA